MIKKTITTLSIVALAAATTALPAAASTSNSGLVQIAACKPCAAKNSCAAKNPCATKNPCNPCAGKNPCNPYRAK